MPPKIVMILGRGEMDALNILAENELRTAREQLRYILRQELQERGLLADARNQTHAEHLLDAESDHASAAG